MWSIVALVFIINFNPILTSCTFDEFDKTFPPLFLSKFDSENIVVDLNGPIEIPEQSPIIAYCSSNLSGEEFEFLEYDTKTVEINCKNGKIKCTAGENELKLDSSYSMKCIEGQIDLYVEQSSHCTENTLLSYGIDYQGFNKSLSDFCYNVDNMETLYVHYNTENTLPDSIRKDKIFRDSFEESIQNRSQNLNSYFMDAPRFSNFQELYEFSEIVESKYLIKNYQANPNILKVPNTVAWWTNLKKGNWKLVENIIKKKSLTENFQVFTGILQYTDLPPQTIRIGLESQLHYMEESKVKTIPLYIWTYLASDKQGFYIFGVNTPFAETTDFDNLKLCNDICESVLPNETLLKQRNIPNLGFVFCCYPNDPEFDKKLPRYMKEISKNFGYKEYFFQTTPSIRYRTLMPYQTYTPPFRYYKRP